MQSPDGEELVEATVSGGPIDAIYQAIDRIVCLDTMLEDFRVEAVGARKDALGEVTVLVRSGDEPTSSAVDGVFSGSGTDGDILRASTVAYVNAINSLYATKAGLNDEIAVAKEGLL